MAEKEMDKDCMISMLNTVTKLFERAIRSVFPELADSIPVAVTPAAQEKFGDYQCNSAMTIAQVDCDELHDDAGCLCLWF